jgi:hypothetical protein
VDGEGELLKNCKTLIFGQGNAGCGGTYVRGNDSDEGGGLTEAWIRDRLWASAYCILTRHLWLVGGGDNVDLGERKWKAKSHIIRSFSVNSEGSSHPHSLNCRNSRSASIDSSVSHARPCPWLD